MNARLEKLIEKYPELVECQTSIMEAFEAMKHAYESDRKLLLAGNGGSAADCEHVVGELMKGFMSKRPLPLEMKEKLKAAAGGDDYLGENLQGALPAISLVSHSALMTAFANDVAPDMVFAQQVYGYGKAGDVFVGFSTSGQSNNINHAVKVAKALGLVTIGFTGKSGGALKELADITICVPFVSTPDIQERHLPIYHALCVMLEEAFFA
ncbi:D-sedoheptulose-7-phosphate isomerase [Neobacillus vireti]|uniref:Sugar isomerase n=1 Tax=Neobacillus vireti LMG 21834 TaxID=1131730 RepID=A0AB94IKC6_9BACI|nr:SIS domain-containing protein [Neobacillus vireti]ETI67516.1 sugar isomerase [Neobacillus vireti LMG 21834]KLT18521.1 phosphoheptose isomerase [Neobacillus vireti]